LGGFILGVSNKIQEEFQAFQFVLEDESWSTSLPDFSLFTSKKLNAVPKVSVIIANYNNAPYLTRMLDSLVHQTIDIENLQIMFIDDCSTDQSLSIVKPYLEYYPNIEIYQLKQNTGGAHGPRNVGINHARGEYSVFLDADDWYEHDALKYLSNLLDLSGDDFAVSGIVQSVNNHFTLKSKPYFIDGDFQNRSIQELPAEFYGWLGPQAIMLRTSLIHENNLHFANQRVADDVTFFYEAMRIAQTITQGERLTTYLNRDADNVSLSKSINRSFMISWLRALGYINQQFSTDISKERFIARRLEWLIFDFCIRRNIGYKFSKKRLIDFKQQLDLYLGTLDFDPSPYFRSDVRQAIWRYLTRDDINGLYRFIYCQSVRWVLFNKFGKKVQINQIYYYPFLLKSLPRIRLNAYAQAEYFKDNQLTLKVYTHQKIVGFEARSLKAPFSNRSRLTYQCIGENEYLVILPSNYCDKEMRFLVILENYLEMGVQNFKKVVTTVK
jgi:glycosyltransferase involved in cell wall biosynthesis